jgi:hypothetical protein
MLKKVMAGIVSVSLALGMVALTAGPANATPAPKVVVCKYVGTPGVDETLQTTITVNANALGHDWDGSTFPFSFSDAHDHSVAIGFEGTTATCPAPQGPPDIDYVTVAWTMPSWVNSTTATWPQQKFASIETEDPNLGALDSQLAASVLCGQEKQWQVDVYFDNAVTDALVAGGYLNGPGSPPESLISGGWGVAYKLVHITGPPCLPQDAAASAQVSQPDCRAAGSPTFTLVNATWSSAPPTTPGSYTITAVADAGHLFPGGGTALDVSYTVLDVLDALGPYCYNPKPIKPHFDFILHCGTWGSIDLVNTEYITYQIVGDGQQGWNHVIATAVAPYVLKQGATADWWIYLGIHWNCPDPKATYEVGPCYADDDESFKNLKVTFDNSASDIGQLFSIPGLSVVEWVPAGAIETETITVPTSGLASYDVYAGLKKVLTIPAVAAFDGCLGVLLEGDPLHENQTCDDGELVDGSIWVDRKEGLKYDIFDVNDLVNPVATLSGVGDGTTELPPGDYKVTLEALPGYVLDVENPATSGPWYYSVLAHEGECDPPTLPDWEVNAAKTDQSCSANGTISGTIIVGAGVDGGPFLDEVNYFINGTLVTAAVTPVAAGTYTVTAEPIDPADALTDSEGNSLEDPSWSLTIAGTSGVCDLTTLALTGPGSNTAGWAGLGYYLLVAGLALIAVRTVRRRNEVKQ